MNEIFLSKSQVALFYLMESSARALRNRLIATVCAFTCGEKNGWKKVISNMIECLRLVLVRAIPILNGNLDLLFLIRNHRLV